MVLTLLFSSTQETPAASTPFTVVIEPYWPGLAVWKYLYVSSSVALAVVTKVVTCTVRARALILLYRLNLLGANVGWHSSNLYYSFYSIFYFFLPRLGKQHEQVISAHFLCCASWMGVVSSDQCSISEGWSHWANQRRHEIHIGELDFESFTEHRRGTSCHHEGAIITFSLVPIDS